MKIINPATEEVIAELETDTPESLDAKYRLLKAARPAWSRRPAGDRIAILERFAALLGEREASLAATLTAETGKPLWQARNEIKGAVARTNWLNAHAAECLREEYMTSAGPVKEKITYEPLGVVGNISAWNYPYLVGVNVFVPALLAGNAVLYKPSELALMTGLRIAELMKDAGVPEDVFQVAAGAGDTGAYLLELPLDGYFFTGSYATGKRIYERVAPKMVPCQLELGGKDPAYIAGDVADIRSVAAGTADGAFYNNGQSCCSVERIYVQEGVYEAYVEAFVEEVRSWKIGDPLQDGVYFGPLTRGAQRQALSRQVEDALEKGASLLCGGRPLPGKGYYFEPSVLTGVTHDMTLMREESFGPVIGIMKVKDDGEALRLMQDTEYGLTASVYSSDPERAEALLEQIDAGTGYWNCCDRVSAAIPWSGRRHSGIGATLSRQGIRAFTKPKAWHLRHPDLRLFPAT